MRKFLITAAAAGVAMAASAAQATEFKGTWSLPTIHTTGDGLLVDATKTSGAFDFTLAPDNPATHHVNESATTINLFTIYTSETSLQGDDLANDPIVLKFNFSLPTPNDGPASIGGDTSGEFELFGIVQEGVLTWTTGTTNLYYGPSWLPQADKGLLTITVNGGEFNEGIFGLDEGRREGLPVTATFDWVRDPSASAAPEPASWALMIGGFGMAGATLRRRRASATAA
jgi:hypothetical protein